MRFKLTAMVALIAATMPAANVPEFTKVFSKQEFARRRDKVCAAIGPNAIAVLKGNEGTPAYVTFRQDNNFFYLSGVETPQALLVMDGRTRQTTLFLPQHNERRERMEGAQLGPDDATRQLTGIANIQNLDAFTEAIHRLAANHELLYTPMAPQELEATSRDLAVRFDNERINDPWDGRASRESRFAGLLRERFPTLPMKNLTPVLDEMRSVKSVEEIAVIRKSSELAAIALTEAMRCTQPGQYEYELNALARFIHLRNGAQGAAYYALIASGPSALIGHYHTNLNRMRDGDMVLMDFAPDYHYYSSDVTRVWPVNGKFSPAQREMYGFYLKCYQAIMKHIRPNVTPRLVAMEAAAEMEAVLKSTAFSGEKYRAAAERFVAGYKERSESARSLGHYVGLSTHDVGAPPEVLKPGMVFTIEPGFTVPEDELHIRLEDMLLITETGVENMSSVAPVDIEAIEALMKENGLLKRYPRAFPR